MINILLDLPNFMVCVLLVGLARFFKLISPRIALILFVSSAVPFVLNDVLFPWTFMGDQGGYWYVAQAIRDWNINDPDLDRFYTRHPAVIVASFLLALIPLPYMPTVTSLGFFNKFIYLITFIGLFRKGYLSSSSAAFLLFYPSLVMYTSLSLKDTLVWAFMLLSLLAMVDKKLGWAICWTLPMIIIKNQNFVICITFIFIYFICNPRNRHLSSKYVFALTFPLLAIAAGFYFFMIDNFNIIRIGMFLDDGGDPADIAGFADFGGLIQEGITGFVYFLMKPFPWESRNAFQLIQSIENIVIFAFISWWTRSCWRISPQKTLFWIMFLACSFAIYGLIVFNFGTAARYRFPFVAVYVVCMIYDCKWRIGFGQGQRAMRRSDSRRPSEISVAAELLETKQSVGKI